MGQTEQQPVIIHNLDLDKVTWASTYCSNARKANIRTAPCVNGNDRSAVFIGDNIQSEQLIQLCKSGYFIGACEGGEQERNNVLDTDITFLVSSTEVTKVNNLLGITDTDKLIVAGFPVDLELLKMHATEWSDKIEKSVCFLGETRPEKNPEFELEVAKLLIQNGFNCFHLSPTKVNIFDQLSNLGVQVTEGIKERRYYEQTSKMQYVVCCSERESLYVSGIEAAMMGSVPIMPRNYQSGYVDWCPPEFMYDYPDARSVLYLIRHVGQTEAGGINANFYDYNNYFARLKSLMEVPHE